MVMVVVLFNSGIDLLAFCWLCPLIWLATLSLVEVEDLFLTFAKKASAFNSWFENAEEDLTDPVRCNSLEEIKALREAHDAFRSSLSSAQADFNQLAELDRQIKSFRVASNPYTWFTMEALEETWRNLQKIIKVNCRRASFLQLHYPKFLLGHGALSIYL